MKPIYVLSIFVISVVLSACAVQPVIPVAPQPVVETKQTVDIDPSFIDDCPRLPLLATKTYSKQEALDVMDFLISQYDICWNIHHQSAALMSKAFNIKTAPPATNK